jgi:hypothetical protein
MSHPGWLLIVLGPVWVFAPLLPLLGRLPGDIKIEGENSRIYIPITTCILLSLVLSGIAWVKQSLWR